nr:UPF0182 family protein [Salsipaludibacter albus]
MRQRLPLVLLGVVLLVLVFSQRVAVFTTDWWWFTAVGAREVFTGVLMTRILLAVVGSLLAGGVIVATLQVARRLRPTIVPSTPQQAAIEQYRNQAEPYFKWLIAGVAALFGISSGVALSGGWDTFLLWRNGGTFDTVDPQFGRDVGFFVFDLPWWQLLQSWAFTTMILVLLLSAGAHLLLGGIRPDAEHDKVLPGVKTHLSILLMVILAIRGWGYWLDRYELDFSQRGTVTGASYTDVNAELPALYLLLAATVVAIALVAWGLRSNSFTLPAVAIALLVVSSILLQGAYPAAIQRLRVDPQELNREREYIEANLEMTRQAYELNDPSLVGDLPTFDISNNLDRAQIDANDTTFENIRLWDPDLLQDNYQELQALRPFYEFHDVDIDRYEIDGQPRQVMLSARELDPDANIVAGQWQNERLTYTHGYGVVASQVNTASNAGQPVFLASDIPPQTNEDIAPDGDLVPAEPGMYYANDGFLDYAIVDTEQPELDYEDPGTAEQVTTSYAGEGGVALGGYARRLAWALRFSDPNFVLSNLLRDDSKVLLHREVPERVREVAPYLTLDSDPYAVVLEDRVVWIQDAYTTTTRYPYSEYATFSHAGGDSEVNYVRNSVKAVVDAYDGTVTMYVSEPDDPIIQTWRRAFPSLYADLDEAPEELASHFRYPEDLFTLQAGLYDTYHIPDPAGFYNKADSWEVPQDAAQKENLDNDEADIPLEPYYLITRLPGEPEAEFVMIQPYVPAGRQNMVAWLAARSDPEHYGELFAVQFPTNDNVLGPVQAHGRIEQESEIAERITLVDQAGSTLIRGNLLVLPVEESVIFVEPLFLQNEQSRIPELWQVVLVMGDQVVMRPTLEDALTALVTGGDPVGSDLAEDPQTGVPEIDDQATEEPSEPREPTEEPTATDQPTAEPTPSPTPTPEPTPIDPDIDPDADAAQLVTEALELFEQADQALAEGDLGAYQDLTNQARARLERAAELGGLEGLAPPTASPTPTAPATAPATGPATPTPSPTGG